MAFGIDDAIIAAATEGISEAAEVVADTTGNFVESIGIHSDEIGEGETASDVGNSKELSDFKKKADIHYYDEIGESDDGNSFYDRPNEDIDKSSDVKTESPECIGDDIGEDASGNIDEKGDVSKKTDVNEAYPPNAKIVEDGKSILTDDNGKPFMEDGERIPNSTYELNSYKYETDDKGRIVHAEGTVKVSDTPRRSNLPDIKDQKETDDKGHVVAHELGGLDNEGNLVPMDSELNRNGDYRIFEREVKKEVNEGKDVNISIDMDYEGDSQRPTSFTVSYEVDGEIYEKTFLNK